MTNAKIAVAFILVWPWCLCTLATAETITIFASGQAQAWESGVLNMNRDFKRDGGWGWEWVNSDHATAAVALAFSLSEIPEGSVISSASLTWTFSNLISETGASEGDNLFGTPDRPSARKPQCKGGTGCSYPVIERWDTDEAFWASEVALTGSEETHALAGERGGKLNPRQALRDRRAFWASMKARKGSLDLMSAFSADSLIGDTVSLVGNVQVGMGRPFFNGEGTNVDYSWNVRAYALVDLAATLVISFTAPSLPIEDADALIDADIAGNWYPETNAAPSTPDVPESGSLMLFGSGLLAVASRMRRGQKNRPDASTRG